MRHAAIQLARVPAGVGRAQRLPGDSVRAAFHYVRTGQTVMPDVLPDADELAALLACLPL